MSSIKGSFQSLREVSRGELFVIMVYDETIFVLKIALFARIRLIDKKENRKIHIKLLLAQMIITTGANIVPYNEGADTTKCVGRLLLSTCGNSITMTSSPLHTNIMHILSRQFRTLAVTFTVWIITKNENKNLDLFHFRRIKTFGWWYQHCAVLLTLQFVLTGILTTLVLEKFPS